jgi:hypothetical protein
MLGISNKNTGAVILLLMILLLSQSRVLDLFVNTALGRVALIVFILAISYLNKTLGVISVLVIILMLNNSGWNILEGAETMNATESTDSADTAAADTDAVATPTAPVVVEESEEEKKKRIDDLQKQLADAKAALSNSDPETEPKVTTEGFDVLETERKLQEGKQSNSIGVDSTCRNCDLVSPVEDNSVFSNFFSVFR